jgi:MFS family permease
MQMAAQSWLVYDLTGSPIWLGLVGASGTVPMLLFSLPAGVVADRLSKRNILLVTQSVAMAQAFALAALTYFGVIHVWHVMVLAAILGTSNAFDMPTRHSMVIELSSREDLLNAVSLNSSAFNAGRIVGPALGGLLIASVGTATCFLINGISYAATLIALAGIAPRAPSPEAKGPMLLQIRGGLGWARKQPLVKGLLAMIAVVSVFAMSHGTLLPVFARDVFDMGAEAYGFLLSSYAVGGLTSALLLTAAGHRRPLGRLIALGSYASPFALAAVAFAPHYGVAVVALFLAGAGLMLFNATTNTLLQRLSPDALRGRVMSMRTLLFAGMMPLGAMQMGALGEWLGPQAAVAIGAAACLVAATVVSWLAPALSRSE